MSHAHDDPLTDVECLAIWGGATRMGAGGPKCLADTAAVALVRLALAFDGDGGWSFPLWICTALGEGGSNADVGPKRVKRLVEDMRIAERAMRCARPEIAPAPPREVAPVDRSARAVVGDAVAPGVPDTTDRGDGQQRGYVVLSDAERAKGFVRPVRRSYVHDKCGALTTMGAALAETYARDPSFYNATFCATCKGHFPVGAAGQFRWDGSDAKVGA